MPQYVTQTEAAMFSSVIGDMMTATANSYLTIASAQVDAFCGRAFDTVLEPLPNDVAMAVSLWAEYMASGINATRVTTSERVGDYAVTYQDTLNSSAASLPCPAIVATLLSPYRILVVG